MEFTSVTWRGRLAALRNLIPLLRMIVESSRLLATCAVTTRMLRAVVPFALLWVSKLILDAIIQVSDNRDAIRHLWLLIAAELVLVAFNDVVGRANTLCESLLADKFTNQVSAKLMRHAATLDIATFEDSAFYDKLSRARDQSSGRISLLVALLNAMQETLTLIALGSGVVLFSPWLLLLLGAAIIPSLFGEAQFATLAYSLFYRWTPQRRQLEYLRLLGSSSASAKEVKIFGLGDYFADAYEKLSSAIYADNKQLAIKRASVGASLNCISTLSYYAAYAVALTSVISGAITLGMFTFLTASFSRSRACIERIASSLNQIAEQAILVNDLTEFFAMQPSIRSSLSLLPGPRRFSQGFLFRNVDFAYPGTTRCIVQNINWELRPAEKVALIGENGAGKTTIIKLLIRLYDPTAGEIFLDGIDLREYRFEDLLRQTSVVFQDYMRYDMTVGDNIGVGNLERRTDQAWLELAAHESGAREFIDRLAGNYSQMLGRRFQGGVELSGGEWQKLALARGYIRDAQLLILDEPTASLDARSEYEVFQRFATLVSGRMAVLISHRFSTVRMADRILVLANGTIEEEGTHKELLARQGRYAELFRLQASSYL